MKSFYVLEGLDGVGKTTLLYNLKKEGFDIFVNPSPIHQVLRKELHNKGKASFFYYLSSNAYIIEELAKNSDKFFIDRYIVSSIIADLYNDGKYQYSDFRNLFNIIKRFFKLPTITFFLVLEEDLRLKRIQERQENNYDFLDKKYSSLWNSVINNYDFSEKVIINADKPEMELVKEITSYVYQRRSYKWIN